VLLLLVYTVFGVNYKGGVGYVNETKRDADTEKLEFRCHVTQFFSSVVAFLFTITACGVEERHLILFLGPYID
jgi:hypothetical protein